MIYNKPKQVNSIAHTTTNTTTSLENQNQFSLNDAEVIQLARWCNIIEKHYQKAMDIEWAKDGINNQLYIVQARPETIHNKINKPNRKTYTLLEKGTVLSKGIALGDKITSGKARVLNNPYN
jgi:pyruvate,water dikinase